MTRRLLAGLTLGAGCLVLTACGGGDQAGAPPIALMPSANPFVSAVVFTDGLGTAKLDVTATVEVGGRTRDTVGSVMAAMDPDGFGIATWTVDGTPISEVASGKAVYDRSAGSTGLWTQHPEGERTTTSRMIAPLTGLGELTDVQTHGTEQIDGSPALRYTGRLAADPDRLRRLGLTDADLTVVGDAWQGTEIDVTAWVDDHGRIVRVDRSYEATAADGSPVRASTSTLLSDFMVDLNLDAPSSGEVTSLAGSSS